MIVKLDSDRAIENKRQDKLSFAGIAKQLAPSIVKASKGDGMVIGLEGTWGSGKTSLLNLLRTKLDKSKKKEIHTITISPWLDGDNSSMVESLLERMIPILEAKEKAIATTSEKRTNAVKKQVIGIGQMLKSYGPKTARNVASVANVSGFLIPGTQIAGEALKAIANITDDLAPSKITLSELKQEIAQKIKDLNIGFVVILDDLDRLEPKQAIEVVRMVRSVADFPRITYLMCYDRKILTHALKTGLKVADGDHYLQKIVQLTFNIPLPEPFDLRIQFRDEAENIYAEVMGSDDNNQLFEDLYSAIDQAGTRLSSPREVKLALNSIRFVFPQVKDNVYFPDFCHLQLIKVTNFKLYQWLEEYLSAYSAMEIENATILNEEKTKMSNRLRKLLPSDDPESNHSILSLMEFIPVLTNDEEPQDQVFNKMDLSEIIKLKRLGSPYHYRFYFALTGPKSVMPDKKFNDLLELAQSDVNQLTTCLTSEMDKHYGSGKISFEHILDRLDNKCISHLNEDQLVGIVIALSGMMDIAMTKENKNPKSSYSIDRFADKIVKDCLRQLDKINSNKQSQTVLQIARDGKAINWLIGRFFRSQLFRHGRVGNEAESPDRWEISEEVLNNAIDILKERVNKEATKSLIPDLPKISVYLYGWMEITNNKKQVTDWVEKYSTTDEGFLNLLDHFRQWTMINGEVCYPLYKSDVIRFFDWDETQARLERLKDSEFTNQVAELQLAITQSIH